MSMPITLNEKEKKLVAAGQVIEAIRSVRERFSLDLVTAKRVVDAYRGVGGVAVPVDSREVLIQVPVRDLLAGFAMQGLLTQKAYQIDGDDDQVRSELVAKDAVTIADELIKALRGGE